MNPPADLTTPVRFFGGPCDGLRQAVPPLAWQVGAVAIPIFGGAAQRFTGGEDLRTRIPIKFARYDLTSDGEDGPMATYIGTMGERPTEP